MSDRSLFSAFLLLQAISAAWIVSLALRAPHAWRAEARQLRLDTGTNAAIDHALLGAKRRMWLCVAVLVAMPLYGIWGVVS